MQESFGPVVTVRVAAQDERAWPTTRSTGFRPQSGRDIGRALSVARRIESGICHINAATVHDEAQVPFGGGRPAATGVSAARPPSLVHGSRWITVQTTPRHYPI